MGLLHCAVTGLTLIDKDNAEKRERTEERNHGCGAMMCKSEMTHESSCLSEYNPAKRGTGKGKTVEEFRISS